MSYTFKPRYAGAFLYHCGSSPVLMHLGAGMFGAIIVDPPQPLPRAKEFVLVQNEFYLGAAVNGAQPFDYGQKKAPSASCPSRHEVYSLGHSPLQTSPAHRSASLRCSSAPSSVKIPIAVATSRRPPSRSPRVTRHSASTRSVSASTKRLPCVRAISSERASAFAASRALSKRQTRGAHDAKSIRLTNWVGCASELIRGASRSDFGERRIARLKRELGALEPRQSEQRAVRALRCVTDRTLRVLAGALELSEVAKADRHVVETLRETGDVSQPLIRRNRELIQRQRLIATAADVGDRAHVIRRVCDEQIITIGASQLERAAEDALRFVE